jgi:hypothetical protein
VGSEMCIRDSGKTIKFAELNINDKLILRVGDLIHSFVSRQIPDFFKKSGI